VQRSLRGDPKLRSLVGNSKSVGGGIFWVQLAREEDKKGKKRCKKRNGHTRTKPGKWQQTKSPERLWGGGVGDAGKRRCSGGGDVAKEGCVIA